MSCPWLLLPCRCPPGAVDYLSSERNFRRFANSRLGRLRKDGIGARGEVSTRASCALVILAPILVRSSPGPLLPLPASWWHARHPAEANTSRPAVNCARAAGLRCAGGATGMTSGRVGEIVLSGLPVAASQVIWAGCSQHGMAAVVSTKLDSTVASTVAPAAVAPVGNRWGANRIRASTAESQRGGPEARCSAPELKVTLRLT